MGRKAFTAKGAVSVGPYSHAAESGGFVYLSGQTPIDPATGKIAEGDIQAQTRQTFANLSRCSRSAGLPAMFVKDRFLTT
jgi:2-iminobutanoate/2-iminopropanoate deaminase